MVKERQKREESGTKKRSIKLHYQSTISAISKSTGDMTHQNKYQRKDVSMASTSSQLTPMYESGFLLVAMLLGRLILCWCPSKYLCCLQILGSSS